MTTPGQVVTSTGRLRFAFAQVGVLLAAADTYVVVLVLPAIMADIGLSIERLQQAAPIVSGFLLGYVAVLPLLGRLSDIYGRLPILLGCLVTFAAGSFLTATSTDLAQVVVGRALQGLGGGGLVPVTLGLVADIWPEPRRTVPLGVVGAVQEAGSVMGPLFGAAVLALGTWRWIFWINLVLAAVVGVSLWQTRERSRLSASAAHRYFDVVGVVLVCVGCVAAALVLAAPSALTDSPTLGELYVPLFGGVGAIASPLALVAIGAFVGFFAWELNLPEKTRPLIGLRGIPRMLRRVDWPGALLLTLALGCIVISFANADPSRQVVSGAAYWLLPLAAILLAGFSWRELTTAAPLVDFRAFSDRAALGALATNLALGAALMAAIVDVPLFARVTAFPHSQLGAALVLVRFLAAVPVGALLGGWLSARAPYRLVCAAAMALSAAMFEVMTTWTDATLTGREASLVPSLSIRPSDLVLVGCGLGFGIAIAPVNAAILAAVKQTLRGLASALVVAARMIGMLAGISLLTAIGLHSYYASQARIPSPIVLCPQTPLACPVYDKLVTGAVLDELRAIFLGASICALAAAVIAALTLRQQQSARSA